MSMTTDQLEALSFKMEVIAASRKELSEWERGFFDDQQERLEKWGSDCRFSPKQMAVIDRMFEKVHGALPEPMPSSRDDVLDDEIPF